ncbi:acyltransferase family protein [Halomonas faecis]|uniref:acyltransferase family protein n=1 Tax=Halomonas faecis TaxID=1562110 RepID=UPI001969C528|nr:acyltransferase [Halomonas faecis]
MNKVTSIPFRYDINGLRAVAVIAVVFFHFRVPGFEAGYLGVDVFFVISGYLMASLLIRGFENCQVNKDKVALVYLDVQGNPWAIEIGLLFSILHGSVSFLMVEQPTRRRLARWGGKRAAAILFGVAAGSASVAGAIEK